MSEICLAGEVRLAPRVQVRQKEAAKLGFTRALITKANTLRHSMPGIEIVEVDRVEQTLELVRELWA